MAEQSKWRGWLTKGVVGVFLAGALLTALLFVGLMSVAKMPDAIEQSAEEA